LPRPASRDTLKQHRFSDILTRALIWSLITESAMPIRPQYRWFYPIDWPQLSASIRFGRAMGRCEHCGRPHGRLVFHLGDGRWWDDELNAWRSGRGRLLSTRDPSADDPSVMATKVVLATAHLDHNPTNNRQRNLKALCQRCHMMHDRSEHQRRRRLTFRMRKALGDLFLGQYSEFS
jgi:hypothetical protein